jgi:nucleotide-binding universal stress UspA family protein
MIPVFHRSSSTSLGITSRGDFRHRPVTTFGVRIGCGAPLQVPMTQAVDALCRSPRRLGIYRHHLVSEEVRMGTAPKKALADKKIQLANILVATDFSPVSHRALDYAISLARRYDSHLYVTHVISADAYPLAAPEVTVGLVETQRRTAENKIQEMLFSGQLNDVPYDILVEEGGLWPAIEKVIEKQGIDLVVVGTHGIGAVQKLVIGSGAEQIFRQCSQPVLTVGPGVNGGDRPDMVFKHILLPTDFGPGCEREIAYAFSIGQEHNATVTLLHVVRHLDDYSDDGLTLKRESVKNQLQSLVPSGGETWCETKFRLAVGDPAAEILRYAEDTRADLIVMGAKARAGLAGHVPGTTAYKVVSKSHCPVLTVRS